MVEGWVRLLPRPRKTEGGEMDWVALLEVAGTLAIAFGLYTADNDNTRDEEDF